MAKEGSAEGTIRDIKRKARRKYSVNRKRPPLHNNIRASSRAMLSSKQLGKFRGAKVG